jgi:AcrR family transcriptional regulator
MNSTKKAEKESRIIDSAEKVFASVGFKNARMEDIAKDCGITKVTLYSYFQSKENLYLAVTYKALQMLNESYYRTIDEYKNKSGLECTIALLETFMSFCENNFLYSEAMLEYFSMVRSTSSGKDEAKLTTATKESIYYMKLQDVHNLPFKLTAKEIERGIKDGSIRKEIDPMFQTLHGWTMVIGYVKVMAASGISTAPIFHHSLKDLKEYNLKLARTLLSE